MGIGAMGGPMMGVGGSNNVVGPIGNGINEKYIEKNVKLMRDPNTNMIKIIGSK